MRYRFPIARDFRLELRTVGQGSAVTVLAVFCEADGEELLSGLGRAGARLLPLTGPDGVEITPALSPPPAPKVNYNKQSLVIRTIDHLNQT